MQTLFFFDDYFIHRTLKFSRRLNHPVKVPQNPVLTADQHWESLLSTYGSVIHDNGIYKMYYTLWWLKGEPPYSCDAEALAYAYSQDGIHWEKPHLNIIKDVNQGKNNCIGYGKFADQPCVHRMEKEIGGTRYIMAYYGDFPPLGQGIRICDSTDGIHWNWPGNMVWRTPLDEVADTLEFYAADDTMSFYYDPLAQRYVILRKVMQEGDLQGDPLKHRGWQPDKEKLQRIIARCDSSDLLHWENHQILLTPDRDDPPGLDFHRLSCTPYAGQYIGFLETHHSQPGKNTIHLELVYSRDSKHWIRPCRPQQPFINNGAEHAWDSGVIFTTPTFLTTANEILIYYGGMDARLTAPSMGTCQQYGVGLAKLPRDRFCSLRCPEYDTAFLTTTPMAVNKNLAINMTIKPGGFLQAGLEDIQGKPVPGFQWQDCDELSGDRLYQPITWKGKTISNPCRYQLQIRARGVDIYALYID
ncbi:MAG: hypothetical protein PVH61_01820 [Candidatus Aminicenantes bacterium]|jgi:hypothetical protein